MLGSTKHLRNASSPFVRAVGPAVIFLYLLPSVETKGACATARVSDDVRLIYL